MSEGRIIALPGDKRKFVVGMSWKHEDRQPSGSAMRAAAKDRGRWVCKRRTSMGSYQLGFCNLEKSKKKQALFSLGALVADAKPEPWLGIFDLGNGLHWYIAVRDNQEILPDGDFVGTPEDIAEARDRHASLGDWTYMDGDLKTILDLVSARKARFLIVDSQAKPWLAPTVASGLLVVFGLGGTLLWKKHEQQMLMDRQMAMARQAALQAALEAKKPKPAPILPWTQIASSTDYFASCARLFSNEPLSDHGWIMTNWACRQNPGGSVSTTLSWQRAGGTDLQTPDGALTNNGDTVQSAVPSLERLAVFAGPPLLSRDTAERVIRSLSQSFGVPLALTMASPMPAPAKPGEKPQVAPPQPWAQWTVGFKLPAAPWALGLGPTFDAIPGLRFNSLVWDGRSWALAGVMYVATPEMQSAGQPVPGATMPGSRIGAPVAIPQNVQTPSTPMAQAPLAQSPHPGAVIHVQ